MDGEWQAHMGEGQLSPTQSPSIALEFLFGGTFDPVHLGHLAVIDCLQNLANEIPIRITPCAIPPLKSQPNTQFSQRVDMLQLATRRLTNIVIDQRESQRQTPSYTIETLQQLKQDNPETSLVLVMGMDTLQEIERWHHWQSLSKFCHLLVINRPGTQIAGLTAHIENAGFRLVNGVSELKSAANGLAICVNMPEKPHSSTHIRGCIVNKQPLNSLLPRSVIEYIRQHHLYQSEII